MIKFLKNEFTGYSRFEKIFFSAMVLLQVIVYCFIPDTPIGMICGIAGVVCVALTAKGKISSYFFNFIQMITYMVICWQASLYLEFGEQIFYFLACIYGVFAWRKNMRIKENGKTELKTKKFKAWHWALTTIVTIITTIIFGWFANNILHSTLSYLDAFTVSLSVIAQLLMVWRYREQWAMWLLINITSLIMFSMLQQWSIVAMYVAWTINTIYGWVNWTKLQKGAE